jgi:hypothetical protein
VLGSSSQKGESDVLAETAASVTAHVQPVIVCSVIKGSWVSVLSEPPGEQTLRFRHPHPPAPASQWSVAMKSGQSNIGRRTVRHRVVCGTAGALQTPTNHHANRRFAYTLHQF